VLFQFFEVHLELLVQLFSVIIKIIRLAQLFQETIFHNFNILLKEQENKTEKDILFPALLFATASTIFLASSTINVISTVTSSVCE